MNLHQSAQWKQLLNEISSPTAIMQSAAAFFPWQVSYPHILEQKKKNVLNNPHTQGFNVSLATLLALQLLSLQIVVSVPMVQHGQTLYISFTA